MRSANNDLIVRLGAANPVPELPAAEPAERVRQLVEDDGPSPRIGARRRRPSGGSARALAVAIAALAMSAIGLVLTDGTSSPGVNVAAAAYAATSAGGGVLEARFVEHTVLPHGRVLRSGHREWIDAAAGRRREQRALPALIDRSGRAHTLPHGSARVIDELATSPGWIETWSSARGEAGLIRRFRYPLHPAAMGYPRPPVNERPAQIPAGIETYRRLYREQAIRVVGRERWHGRLLWKLEGYASFIRTSAHAKLVPIMAQVVLVDPRTYLPVVQRFVMLTPHGRRVNGESYLVSYRRLPGGKAGEALLKLTSQHPHARVVEPLVENTRRRRRR